MVYLKRFPGRVETAWCQQLRVNRGGLLSSVAFNFNLRRYSLVNTVSFLVNMVRRCRLNPSHPC